MRASIFIGDIADVEAEAICTSTNPRLSLMMGTGAAVRARGGYEILRACEEIVSRDGPLPPGSAWPTTAGSLASKVVIHCVASDANHRSSEATIAMCVRNALDCAARAGCRTVAMPVFASGHAHVNFRRAA
jgi:O-acetyl-ADP-ribose deacetylase